MEERQKCRTAEFAVRQKCGTPEVQNRGRAPEVQVREDVESERRCRRKMDVERIRETRESGPRVGALWAVAIRNSRELEKLVEKFSKDVTLSFLKKLRVKR